MSWFDSETWEKKLSQGKEIPQFYRYKGNERGFLNSGAAHLRNGEFGEAEEDLKRAIEVKPDYATAWYYLGEVYEQQERWEEAEKAFRKSMDYCPHDSGAGVALYTILMEQMRGEEALAIGLKILDVHPEAAEMWDNLAVLYLALGDVEKSLECDRRARILLQRVHPDRPELWYTQLSRLRETDDRVARILSDF